MSASANNSIPFVPENTIDPAAGLNESINTIDALLQLAVLTVNTDTAPASPAEGDRHIVGIAPSGAWAGKAGKLARFLDGYWSFYDARLALDLASGILYSRSGAAWLPIQAEASVAVNGTPASAMDFEGAGVTVKDNGDGTAIVTIAGGDSAGAVLSVAGRTGDVELGKEDVGLAHVDNTADADKPVSTHQQTALDKKVDAVADMGLSERSFTQTEKTKLADVAVGATKNATDAELRDRATHTGKQLATTIADILGAVSQTMGVPTGALMEAGTNANGTYWRFANGLQICTRSITTLPANVAQGPIFVSPQVAGGSLPMPFAATPSMVPMGATNVGLGWVTMYTFPSTTSWGAWAMYSGQTSSVNGTIWLTAIGRWY